MNKLTNLSRLTLYAVVVCIVLGCTNISTEQPESAAMKRFRIQGLKYESDNEFYTRFRTSPAIGLGYEEGVVRRDPTDVIKIGNRYYVWYTRTAKGPAHVGLEKATDTLRAYSWDRADNFMDTDKQPGPGITWGLFHERRDMWHYLMRFDGNLSLKRGDELKKRNK